MPVDTSREAGMIPDGDVFIHAGDLMTTGYPDDWQRQIAWLKLLPHKIKLFVPGNHDFHLQVYPGPALQEMRAAGVWVIGLPGNNNYSTYKLPNSMTVVGFPGVIDLPRWAFNSREIDIAAHLRSFDRCDIVVSHSPIYSILDKANDGRNGGIAAYQYYLRKHHPLHWIHGHIHEQYGEQLFLKDGFSTTIHNVAMCNRSFQQVNPPVIIDL